MHFPPNSAKRRPKDKKARANTSVVTRTLVRAIRWALIVYWITFLGYTVLHYSKGGVQELVAWFAHIGGSYIWSWKSFATGQIVLLLVTILAFATARYSPDR